MPRFGPKAVTILELGRYFRGQTIPEIDGQLAPWDCLLAELSDGGYLRTDADLGQLLESGADPVLAESLPADAVRRIFATAGHRQYQLHMGYLQWWGGREEPALSAAEVFARYGFPLIAKVDGSYSHMAPVPGQLVRRIRAWAGVGGKVLLGVPMGVVMAARVAAAHLAAVPRLAARAEHLGDRNDGQTAPGAPAWQAELASLARDLGIDKGEIHRSFSGQTEIGELEIVAVRAGQRKDVLMAVSRGIFQQGYQVRSRPRHVPFRFTSRTGESPEIEFTPIAAGESLPGSGGLVRDGQVGLRFVIRIPVVAEQDSPPGNAPGATTSKTRTRANRELEAAALYTAFAAIPGFAALACCAVQTFVPVDAMARILTSVVASTLAVSISFWLWLLLGMGLAMDASPHHGEVPRSMIRAYLKFLLIWLIQMTVWNAMAAFVIAGFIAVIIAIF